VTNPALPIVRHLVSLLIAWLGTSITPAQATEVEGALTTVGLVMFCAIWAIVEKALKSVFGRYTENP